MPLNGVPRFRKALALTDAAKGRVKRPKPNRPVAIAAKYVQLEVIGVFAAQQHATAVAQHHVSAWLSSASSWFAPVSSLVLGRR
jgi:hypothetical protein